MGIVFEYENNVIDTVATELAYRDRLEPFDYRKHCSIINVENLKTIVCWIGNRCHPTCLILWRDISTDFFSNVFSRITNVCRHTYVYFYIYNVYNNSYYLFICFWFILYGHLCSLPLRQCPVHASQCDPRPSTFGRSENS